MKMEDRLLNTLLSKKVINTLFLNLGLAAIYFILARLGLFVASVNHSVSPVWPATGFAFSIVYLFGYRTLIAVILGAFAANFLDGTNLAAAILISIGNALEAFVGAYVLHRVYAMHKQFSYQTETIAIVTSACLGSMVSATIGIVALYTTGAVPSAMITQLWLTWWIGDALGGLVVTPILLHLSKHEFKFSEFIHAVGILIFASGLFYFVFMLPKGSPFLFLLFPVLLYTLRFVNKIYVLLIAFFISFASIYATVNGMGAFAMGELNERLVHLQLFLGSMALTALMLTGFGKERLTRLPSTVLLFCWIFAGALFFSFEQSEKTRTDTQFDNLVRHTQNEIVTTMKTYEEALRGGTSLYAASKSVQLNEWRAYFNALKILENYKGINGLGVIWPITERQAPSFLREIRAQGVKDFTIKSLSGAGSSHTDKTKAMYVIKFIEPLNLNAAALGLDIASEPKRREAAELARDTGLPTITKKIILVQDKEKTPGLNFYLPMYKTNTKLDTVEDRRKSHLGWIYGPFICEKFFDQILSPLEKQLELKVYEGAHTSDENLLYHSPTTQTKKFKNAIFTEMVLGQRNLILVWNKGPAFISSHNTIIAWVSFCGALASLLLTNLMVSLQLLGRRSRELADELTAELSESREKFKEGERRLLYALEGSNDGIWDWNITHSEMYVSGKICAIYGWPQVAAMKTIEDMRQYVHPEDLKKISVSMMKHLAGETKVHEVETRYKNANGEWSWVLTRGKVSERDEKGQPTRMTGVHININALKVAQLTLEKTQYQLRSIANSVPSLISQWDENLICEFANDSYASWFGLNASDIPGMSMREVIGDAYFESRREMFEKALTGIRLDYEKEVVRVSDGQKRFVIATYLPHELNGKDKGFFLFVQDITDLKRAELIAVEERRIALEATNIKSQFLANMSHEIRTPINGIVGMTNLLKTTSLTPQQLEYTDIVTRSSESLLNIINDILDFSKIEAGKMDIEVIDFDLKQLLTDIQKSFAFFANQKGIELILDIELGPNSFFKGDPGRLQQVFNNLVGNAIKFTSKGSVTIIARRTKSNQNSETFHFQVVDSGIGISGQALGRMFQAFSQEDSTTSRRFGGTGLGLSISKQLVELMHGEIGVESEPDVGSTFWFNLTLAHGQRTKEEAPVKPVAKITTGAKILIAEDNRVNQIIALKTLRKWGYHPHAVASGNEVLDALRESTYDLILMDCQMPEMDGYQTTSIIRTSDSLNKKEIPIVAMTGSASENDRKKCFSSGMNDYITKPVRESDLIFVIEKWLDCKPIQTNKKIASKGHILVVEDNDVNQSVISLNLEQLSYSYDIAADGFEALERLKDNAYDLILMDCQMPLMDGYQAAIEIRQSPIAAVAEIPIIALTANAAEGNREKCLSFGMNDFMTKPIDVKILSRTLGKWMKFINFPKEISVTQRHPAKNQMALRIDLSVIEELRGLQKPGRPDLLTNLINLFQEVSEENIEKIRIAVMNKDMNALYHAAHSLKSCSANVGALGFADLCLELENLGEQGTFNDSIVEILHGLENEYVKVLSELKGFKAAA